jgi:hypothetical protein
MARLPSLAHTSEKKCCRSRVASKPTELSWDVKPRSRSHSSAGRASQSHSAVLFRHSSRSKRTGARDRSPKRSCLQIARPKSDIRHNSRISAPRTAVFQPNSNQKRHQPAQERSSLKIRKTQIRFSAVQGLLFGSSSSVMLRLIGHGVVSEKNFAGGGQPPGVSFRRRNDTRKAAIRPLQFQAQFQPLQR